MTTRFRPQFLVRFDDLCPSMNWTAWDAVEAELDRFDVKPIAAVVPDNHDPELEYGVPRAGFWERVRSWQAKGWAVAMHGYQHRYVTPNAGILKLNARSEFAGLPREVQERKIQLSWRIFQDQGVTPSVWVAPAHSFDWDTVTVLNQIGIRIISDGLHAFPYRDRSGMFWIPQQLWRFRPVPPGTWTVCYHHNNWKQQALEHFRDDIRLQREQITDVATIAAKYSGRRLETYDRVVQSAVMSMIVGCHQVGRVEGLARHLRAKLATR